MAIPVEAPPDGLANGAEEKLEGPRPLVSELLTQHSAKMSGFGGDQGVGATAVVVPRSRGEPGKASPMRGG